MKLQILSDDSLIGKYFKMYSSSSLREEMLLNEIIKEKEKDITKEAASPIKKYIIVRSLHRKSQRGKKQIEDVIIKIIAQIIAIAEYNFLF